MVISVWVEMENLSLGPNYLKWANKSVVELFRKLFRIDKFSLGLKRKFQSVTELFRTGNFSLD
ncbi:unnamed protein product [Meloidogyne enterolobii]|uniref:Uncharacterized protein n=1 Tax=Meloidogyne enterolobii TaxID=390850 RepID=A0ACB0YW76_MELEN